MQAMQKTTTILDLRSNQLYMYSGPTDDVLITIPKNSKCKKFKLVQAGSGHIMLPCTGYDMVTGKPVDTVLCKDS